MIALQFRRRRFSQVAPLTLGVTILVSLGGMSFALLQGWPLWLVGAATGIRGYRYSPSTRRAPFVCTWLAPFYVLRPSSPSVNGHRGGVALARFQHSIRSQSFVGAYGQDEILTVELVVLADVGGIELPFRANRWGFFYQSAGDRIWQCRVTGS